MPIPTDTYRNIRWLNWFFAISAVLLFAITGWSIIQDYDKTWRKPQQASKVWQAALVEEKIDRETTPEKKARLAELQKQIDEQEAKINDGDSQVTKLRQQIRVLDSDRLDLEFKLNTVKANVTVDETALQDAITAGDSERARQIEQSLEAPRNEVREKSEKLAQLKQQIEERRKELAEQTNVLDELTKEQTRLTESATALQKKLESLRPPSLLASISQEIRRTPLLQFMNPAEKVQQVVLPDIVTDMGGFKQVESIDRCMTCHVNIASKDFTEDNVMAYLEEQVASIRELELPEERGTGSSAAQATALTPGAVAMPEFWHLWARELAPAVVVKSKSRITPITNTVGKLLSVTIDAKPVEKFSFDAALTDPDIARQQDLVLTQLVRALLSYDTPADQGPFVSRHEIARGSDDPQIIVEIPATAEAKAIETARTAAIKYIEQLASDLSAALREEQLDLLRSRYRVAMIEIVNGARRDQGYAALDPSAVQLAHPDLRLYVDVDSPHSFEKVGCTSCHDGSGYETDFVLAAHTPRPIWVDQKTGTPVLPLQVEPVEALAHHKADLSSMLKAVYPHDAVVPVGVPKLHLALSEPPHAVAATQQSAAVTSDDSQHLHPPQEPPEDVRPTDYIDPVTGVYAKAVSQAAYWKDRYEAESGTSFKDVNHYWDRPMLPPKYLQANCVRCHTSVDDIQDHAPVVHRGRQLFKQNGCVNCHQMDSIAPEAAVETESDPALIMANGQRKVGPDLRHVTSKLSPAMINSWIWSPKAFRPSTRMPHFFMLENSSSDEEIRRTKQEARAITEYLARTATPLQPKYRIPTGVTGKIESGQKLFNSLGCLACHTNLNDIAGTKKVDGQSRPFTLGEKWITTDLIKSGELAAEMEAKLGKAPDSKTLSAEAQRLYEEMTYNQRQLYALEHLGVETKLDESPKYPDGSPKPMFVHHGPELSGIGQKLTAGRSSEEARQWLFDWLKEPRHYSEYTIMPQLRVTDQEAVDLVEYLLAQRRSNDKPGDSWQAGLTAPDSEKLIELSAFFLRSRYSIDTAKKKADDEAELTALAAESLLTEFIDESAAKEMAAEMSQDERRMVFLGKKLISHYGCMSCHAINGTETLTSPCANLSDWGGKTIDKLDFGYLDHHKVAELPERTSIPMVNALSTEAANLVHRDMTGEKVSAAVEVAWPHLGHTRVDWLTQKLKNTRIFDRGKVLLDPKPQSGDVGRPYDKLKMPTFYLRDDEVDAIVTWVIANRFKDGDNQLISRRLLAETNNPEAQRIAEGRRLVEKYNCINCHQVDNNAPPVHQWYKPDEITTKAPPSLRGEGNKIQHDWLFNFLKDVEPLRPLPVIRMPSFPLEDEEITAIAAYFAAESNRESDNLRKTIDPVLKYVDAAYEEHDRPLFTDSPWPGDDWFTLREFQSAAEMLSAWGLENGHIRPLQLDKSRNSPIELGQNFRQLLFKARFITELYDAPYPFTDSPRPELDEDAFTRGERLFYEMQCLKCHIMGDPAAPGATAAPTAPNLSLVYRRLQRRWVRHWVQEPGVIQIGTAMPPFFTGLSVFRLDGLPWPRSQGVTGDDAARAEQLYGPTADQQTDLLLDFLYAAGVRDYTAVQPTTAPTEPLKPTFRPASTQPVGPHDKPILQGKDPEEAKPKPEADDEAPAPAPAAPEGVKLTGTVKLQGQAPTPAAIDMSGVSECAAAHSDAVPDPSMAVSATGELKDAIVYVEGVDGTFATPGQPAVLDQHGCMYEPHVLSMQVGQDLVVKNSDPFLHNVHSMATANPAFNFGQSNVDPGKKAATFKAVETFRVKCDVHPWMSAYIRVFDHPFHAVTKADGTFAIDDLPPGTYTVTVWHEMLGEKKQPITIEAGKPATMDLTVSAGSARAAEHETVVKTTVANFAKTAAGTGLTVCEHCQHEN